MKGLDHAVLALEALAGGRVPEQASVLAGALALKGLAFRTTGHDIFDALSGLETLATGGTLDLNSAGRERAGKLAEIVRGHNPQAKEASGYHCGDSEARAGAASLEQLSRRNKRR
jgi:hypothetical protein